MNLLNRLFKTIFSKITSKSLAVFFVILIAATFYAATLKGVPGNIGSDGIKDKLDKNGQIFELSPERGRYAHIQALATTGHYDLSQQWAEVVYPDVGYQDGKFYSFFAPGLPYLAFPFYQIGAKYGLGTVASFAFIAVFSIFAIITIYAICRKVLELPIWASMFGALTFAFGSTAWSYALTIYQHHLTTFFMLFGFFAIWKYKTTGGKGWNRLWVFIPWACYALGIFIDYPNAILMLPVMVYLLIVSLTIRSEENNEWSLGLRITPVLASVAFIAITGFHLMHNSHYFGSPLQLSGGLIGWKVLREQNLEVSNSHNKKAIEDIQKDKQVSGFFSENDIPRSFTTLLLSSDRGLLMFIPLLVLGMFGIWLSFRKKLTLEHGILLSLILTNVFLYSSWDDPWGGWAYGPRYLIPTMAILAVYTAVWVHERKQLSAKIIAWALFAYSSGVALLGALTTNAVPPKVEAVYIGDHYNFLKNWLFLQDGKTSSFLFNTYFSRYVTLQEYAAIIYISLLVMAFLLLFGISKWEQKKTYEK